MTEHMNNMNADVLQQNNVDISHELPATETKFERRSGRHFSQNIGFDKNYLEHYLKETQRYIRQVSSTLHLH